VTNYLALAALLVLQNAAFTLVSRARNSGSYAFHAAAAVGSNGVWFVSQLLLLDQMLTVIRNGTWSAALALLVFYTACTVTGSVGMHWLSVNYIEKGKRKVGA
jgi:hypothetical protein